MEDKSDLPLKDSSTLQLSRRLKLDQFLQLPPPSTLAKKKPGEARVLTSAKLLLELDKKGEEMKKQVELKEQVRLEKAAAQAAKKAPHAASVPKSGLRKGCTVAGSKFP